LQWLQGPSEINGDNLNKCKTRRQQIKKEYLKDKINELTTNSKTKNIRGLYRGTDKSRNGY
jgi:hypothetical protein